MYLFSKSFWKSAALGLAIGLTIGFVYYSATAAPQSKLGELLFPGSKSKFGAANTSLNM